MKGADTRFSDLKERVRGASEIVEVVGQHVKLRRVGSNWQGLCPFHHEKTPSFNVNPERQNYYCFGCQRGGDVFSFVMEQEGVSFKEALLFLAQRAGIPVEEALPSGGSGRHDRLYRINEAAADFYHRTLDKAPGAGRARDYLRERGISDASIESFQLGFAPQTWRLLHEHQIAQGFAAEDSEGLGLIRRKSSGPGYYDTFRNRILFPVRSVAGRVLGFGARVLDDSLPKYINSSDSPIYTKKSILYGLHRAYREIRRAKLAVLVEGYFDVISLHQAGLPQAVAVCGTAFSNSQARLLKRYTERVCVITDGDAAGLRAAVRASGVLMAEGLRPSIALLEADEDPDTMVRQEGAEAFRARIKGARGYIAFMRELVRGRGDRPAERERAVRRLLEDMTVFPDGDLHLDALLRETGEVFELDRRVLVDTLAKARRPSRRGGASAPQEATAAENPEESGDGAQAIQEKLLLRALLDEGEARDAVLPILGPEHFADPLRARIYSNLAALGRCPSPGDLAELFPDPAAAAVVGELSFLELPEQGGSQWAGTAALRLKLKRLLELNRDFQGRVQALELAGESIQADLLEEWRHVGESIRQLRVDIDRALAKRKGS